MDQADRLAGKDGRDFEIACGPGRHILYRNFVRALHQLDLAAGPALDMAVDQRSRGKRRRPEQFSRPVGNNAAHRVICIGRTDAFLRFRGAIGLHARIEARADQHAGCTEHHHCREAPAIGDPAGRNDWHAPGCKINDRRHDIDGGARCAMAARLCPLRDQNLRAGIERLLRHVLALDLADQSRTAHLDLRRERRGIAERQHDRLRARIERDVEKLGLLCQAPGDEADAERCKALQLRCLSLKPGAVAVATTEDPEATGLADGAGQPGARDRVHGRRQDRMPDPEKLRQRRGDRHGVSHSGQEH
jgi:hypothetical protein